MSTNAVEYHFSFGDGSRVFFDDFFVSGQARQDRGKSLVRRITDWLVALIAPRWLRRLLGHSGVEEDVEPEFVMRGAIDGAFPPSDQGIW